MEILKHKYYDRKDKNDSHRHWTDPDDDDDSQNKEFERKKEEARQKYEEHILNIKSPSTPIETDHTTPVSTPKITENEEYPEPPVASTSSPLPRKAPLPELGNSSYPNNGTIITETDIEPSKNNIPKNSISHNLEPISPPIFQEPISEDPNMTNATASSFTSSLKKSSNLINSSYLLSSSSTVEPTEINEPSDIKVKINIFFTR